MSCSYCTANPALKDRTFCGRILCYARWFILESKDKPLPLPLPLPLTALEANVREDHISTGESKVNGLPNT